MATERMKKAHRLISGGMDVEAAMEEAGYGPGCIPGLAPQFPAILAEAGLPIRPTRVEQPGTPRPKAEGTGGRRGGKAAADASSDDADGSADLGPGAGEQPPAADAAA